MQPLTLAAAGPFIMDALREVGVAQMVSILLLPITLVCSKTLVISHEFEAGTNYHAHNVIDRRLCRDDDLIQPFQEAEEQAAEETSVYGIDHLRSELETLMDIVRQNRIQHREAMKPKATKGLSKTTLCIAFTAPPTRYLHLPPPFFEPFQLVTSTTLTSLIKLVLSPCSARLVLSRFRRVRFGFPRCHRFYV